MKMVWPLPDQQLECPRPPARPQASAAAQLSIAPSAVDAADSQNVLRRVAAVLASCALGKIAGGASQDMPGPAGLAALTALTKLTEFAATGLLQVDTFATRFDGPDAVSSVRATFAQIAVQHRKQPYDAILVIGCGTLEPDVGMLHTVLAPCIATAGIPVLTAVGSDDANTILGDVARQVFADPTALMASVATRLSPVPLPAIETIGRIRSLAAFVLTDLAAESHILLDAAIRPALQRQLASHASALERWRCSAVACREFLKDRVARELALLDNLRTYVDQQLMQHTEQRRLRSRRFLTRLRLLAPLAYASLVALLWATTTTQQTVFFGGCALVLLSAVYTTLSNRIVGDIEAFPVRADGGRARQSARADATVPAHLASQHAPSMAIVVPPPGPDSIEGCAPFPSRPSSGVPMNEQPNQRDSQIHRGGADDYTLLSAILQRLEQSDHLSLDELDALILQADAAYKARLAQLEHTSRMIARLGAPSGIA